MPKKWCFLVLFPLVGRESKQAMKLKRMPLPFDQQIGVDLEHLPGGTLIGLSFILTMTFTTIKVRPCQHAFQSWMVVISFSIFKYSAALAPTGTPHQVANCASSSSFHWLLEIIMASLSLLSEQLSPFFPGSL
jgi:hypothetical protein